MKIGIFSVRNGRFVGGEYDQREPLETNNRSNGESEMENRVQKIFVKLFSQQNMQANEWIRIFIEFVCSFFSLSL